MADRATLSVDTETRDRLKDVKGDLSYDDWIRAVLNLTSEEQSLITL